MLKVKSFYNCAEFILKVDYVKRKFISKKLSWLNKTLRKKCSLHKKFTIYLFIFKSCLEGKCMMSVQQWYFVLLFQPKTEEKKNMIENKIMIPMK